jgi:hypothetical protein
MKYLKSAGDQPTEIYTFINRRSLMKLFCLAGINLGFAIGACDFRKVDPPAQTNSKKESSMESIQSAQSIQNKIPLIDTAIALETETATFALG